MLIFSMRFLIMESEVLQKSSGDWAKSALAFNTVA